MRRPRRGRIVIVDLDGPRVDRVTAQAHELAYVVLRRAGRVVGRHVVDGPGSFDPAGAAALPAEAEELSPRAPDAAAVSVVVATRNRPEDLSLCLEALRRLTPAPGEIVVSDSASADAAAVAAVAGAAGAVLVRSERAGLSLARNAGARAARGAVLAFVDDDCRVEAGWLEGIRRGFSDERVVAVTGGFLPAELESEAQLLFLRYSHMERRGPAPRRFALSSHESRHWPLDAWRMGSGGNLAARADVFARLGGFREDLGLGTPVSSGEDLYFLWSAIVAGGTVVYRPDVVAWHRHQRELASLHAVMTGYGRGHAAYLAAARRAGASPGAVAGYLLSMTYDRLKRLASSALTLDAARAGLVFREMAGLAAGGRR